MPFKIVFITEGPDANPAAEIEFDNQRLCVVRLSSGDGPEIEFVQDLYLGQETQMVFPLKDFLGTIQIAVADLTAWVRNLQDGGAGPNNSFKGKPLRGSP